jgi:hypothetical protein
VSLQEAILNTTVKIKSCTRASAAGKNEYNLERTKNRDKDILVLEKNEMPKEKNTLSKEQKKEIKSLQSKLSTYKKRLAKAIEDGKEKSIKTNQKNIDKILKDLSKIEKSDKRQKQYTEFTIALTNSQKGDYAENWSEKALEFIKKEFPDLQVISAAEHRDQSSPHIHILTYSPDKPVTQVLAQYAGQKDTKRESMKEAYGFIARKFHSFANENIAYKELNKLHKGRKYVSLGQYKQKGNFEAKKRLQEQKNSLPALKTEHKQLDKRLIEANLHLKPQEIGDYSLEVHTSKGLLGTKHFITQSDIDRKRDSLLEYADKAGEILDTDASSVKETIGDYFKTLEDHSKKGKEKQQPHFPKEPVLKIKLEIFKQWKKDFNKYLKDLNTNVKKMIDEIREKKNSIEDKIHKHPDSIKQRKEQEVKRQESINQTKQRKQTSKVYRGR